MGTCNFHSLLRRAPAALAIVLAGAAQAAQPAQGAAAQERARIQAEIQRTNAAFAAEEAACGQRFAVTACVEESRQRRREALAPLRAQTLALDDAERRQRAASRRATLETKRQQAAQRPAPPPELPQPAAPHAAASAPPRAPLIAPGASQPRQSNAEAQRTRAAAEAAGRVQAAQRRTQQAQEDAARIQARQAARDKKGKKAQPLPVPGRGQMPGPASAPAR